ncbi:hypothetical protein [Acinetobacter sp. 243_ASPC]|uniref:hypothetical protein n=1 Tax=Acinetobacter sp. 243_ASPC TaxID=1579345 RepID=UPI00066049FA|nr:hypothetical protein [Acinetobacter sp. 243_ASPC]
MIVPDSTQVPLYEPIYSNGVISQVWVMFFQKLAKLANNTDANGDILELIQLANQLPTNAHLAQQGFDIAEMQNVFTTVPIHQSHIEEMPPVLAVFLCDQEIMPLCAIPMSVEPVLPVVTLPSSEIIHD